VIPEEHFNTNDGMIDNNPNVGITMGGDTRNSKMGLLPNESFLGHVGADLSFIQNPN